MFLSLLTKVVVNLVFWIFRFLLNKTVIYISMTNVRKRTQSPKFLNFRSIIIEKAKVPITLRNNAIFT